MNDIVFKLPRMDGDRMRRYTENLQFYNGKQWTARQARGEKQLTVNYAKALVDKMSSYLMAGFSFAVDPRHKRTYLGAGSGRRAPAVPRPRGQRPGGSGFRYRG